ncbi:unnamed protein product [Effrenium voratum]|nr:unnamed protein product [Effrenium voratum]
MTWSGKIEVHVYANAAGPDDKPLPKQQCMDLRLNSPGADMERLARLPSLANIGWASEPAQRALLQKNAVAVANPPTALRPQSASLEAAHHRQREQLRHRKESVEQKDSCGPSQLRLRLRISRSHNWQSHCRSSHALAPEPTPNMPKQFNFAQKLSLVFWNESF